MEIEKANLKILPVGERNLLLLVCCKLLCAVANSHIYDVVTATFECGGYDFTVKGKRDFVEGWREIHRIFRSSLKDAPEDEEAAGDFPEFTQGQTFQNVKVTLCEHFTSPPKPYTEDTLLSAMETAGKEDMPDDAERKGLGTPATRAAIIEKLVAAGFVERKGNSLIPTKDGIDKLSSSSVSTDLFLSTVRKYTRAKKLTPRMLNELINRIEVHQAEKINGEWVQRLTIHYNCIGALFIPNTEPLPVPNVTVNTRRGVYVTYEPAQNE